MGVDGGGGYVQTEVDVARRQQARSPRLVRVYVAVVYETALVWMMAQVWVMAL